MADKLKIGVDDAVVQYGSAKVTNVIEASSKFDPHSDIIDDMNSRYAFVERDRFIYDFDTGSHIPKDSFTFGSEPSTRFSDDGQGKDGEKSKRKLSHATIWLTHPRHEIVQSLGMRPTGERFFSDNGIRYANTWRGLQSEPGDATPFVRLTEHLFSRLPPELRDFAIKFWAYKAQNPDKKTPIAFVLVGPQGSGKSLWADMLARSFAPHYATVSENVLTAPYNSFMRNALVAVINEASGAAIKANGEKIKEYISEQIISLNEKYRNSTDITNYTQFIFCSNHSSASRFDHDDRRMFVVRTPPPAQPGLYDDVLRDEALPRYIMHYLLNYELHGWKPPKHAPHTIEKEIAAYEALEDYADLAKNLRDGETNWVKLRLDATRAWALNEIEVGRYRAEARAILSTITAITVRPWYAAEELTALFPLISGKHPATHWEISAKLRDLGVPVLQNANHTATFKWAGHGRPYLIIADRAEWQDKVLTQEEFDVLMQNAPRYGAMI